MWLGMDQKDPTIYKKVSLVSLNHSMTIYAKSYLQIIAKTNIHANVY